MWYNRVVYSLFYVYLYLCYSCHLYYGYMWLVLPNGPDIVRGEGEDGLLKWSSAGPRPTYKESEETGQHVTRTSRLWTCDLRVEDAKPLLRVKWLLGTNALNTSGEDLKKSTTGFTSDSLNLNIGLFNLGNLTRALERCLSLQNLSPAHLPRISATLKGRAAAQIDSPRIIMIPFDAGELRC